MFGDTKKGPCYLLALQIPKPIFSLSIMVHSTYLLFPIKQLEDT